VTSPEEAESVIKARIKSGLKVIIPDAVFSFISLARVAKDWNYSFETIEKLPEPFVYKVYV